MRFLNSDTITFTDKNGNTFPIKDALPIANYETMTEINIPKGSSLDEIISRKEYYGDANEDLSHTIFDHNIVSLYEAEFNMDKIKKIKVPLIEETS